MDFFQDSESRCLKLGQILLRQRPIWVRLGTVTPSYEVARATVEQAELDYQFTRVYASVDGYITSLNLRLGSQAVANQPALALVDVNSYWIDAYFRENYISNMRAGDIAIVTLMTYPDRPIRGKVDSLGWGIAQSDGSTGYNLLPTVNPTFEWIRLAQRIPVRVHLDKVPEDIALRIGSTASVLVITGGKVTNEVPVNSLLQ